ncbi:uncharacterized protein LOC115448684 isoform X2 [Manduca sexta]|uniref:uncharacterized protein LOC115448684 isoform X2 n=1 Tax=Manduca sexta TaxID=7130 RepID=UPI00188EED51|nr:uncharacterized protein LOC115448684 isoform X2 [Manduca sexta]
MRIPLVLCAIVLVCHRADCTLSDFFNNLPTEIGNALTHAWSKIVMAIKKPVRIKRLGKAKTTKTPLTTTTHFTPIELVHRRVPTSTEKYDLLQPSLRRLMLPVLTIPKWENLEQWKKLQKPSFVELKPGWVNKSHRRYINNSRGSGGQRYRGRPEPLQA